MGITDVVRGDDLLTSTPRQILLADLLGHAAPRYWHVPLVVASDGARLAKRTPSVTVRSLREARVAPERIIAVLTEALGATRSAIHWRREPWRIPERW
jgi:glutamyl-tRNA synthetase